LATALAAGVGVAVGVIALDPDAVKRLSAEGPAILVRRDTATTDIEGMALAAGILTASGGRTSHAAVVARQLGKVCLVGCSSLDIDLGRRQCRIGETLFNEGDFISLDGNAGAVYAGRRASLTERPERALAAVAGWRVPAA
jgi:pyruvate,orthophosphate dikinase